MRFSLLRLFGPTTRSLVLLSWQAGRDSADIADSLGLREPAVLKIIHAEQDRRHAKRRACA